MNAKASPDRSGRWFCTSRLNPRWSSRGPLCRTSIPFWTASIPGTCEGDEVGDTGDTNACNPLGTVETSCGGMQVGLGVATPRNPPSITEGFLGYPVASRM